MSVKLKNAIDIKTLRFIEITLTKSHEFDRQDEVRWMFPCESNYNILKFFYEAIPSASSDLIDSLFYAKIAVFRRDGWYLCVRTEDLKILE